MFQPEQEAMAPDALHLLQSQRLVELVARLRASTTPYWRAKLADVGRIGGLEDLRALPFTTKAEMRETFPYGMLAVPLTDTVRVHASSGTRGKPTVVGYTPADIDLFAEVNARSIVCAGGSAGDVLHVAYGYGLFTGGLGLHYGGEWLGATVVPASGGNPGFQVQLLADLAADGLACTPSFALLLAERAAAEGLLDRIPLRYGILGAEPWSEGMRAKIEAAWGGRLDACDIYGLSEVIGPGVAAECHTAKGAMHVFEDHFYPEVVDPETEEPLPPGERGELVITTLTKEAQPVIRYRTGDITRLLDRDCPCGRTLRRIERLSGRADDMLIVRGINVYPREIEEVLLGDPAVGGQYAIIVDRRSTLPELEVRLELTDQAEEEAARVAERLARQLLERIRLRVAVQVLEPGSMPRQEVGKAKRVFTRVDDTDPMA